jgi:hypothetical protein
MNWEGYSRKLSWHDLKYYIKISLEGLRKTVKIVTEEDDGSKIKNSQIRKWKLTAECRNEKRTKDWQRGLRAERMKCGK